MSVRRCRPALLLVAPALFAACAPFVPQRSVDRTPLARREAAFALPVFAAGGDTAPPAALVVLAPIEAHSCQFWEFDAAPTRDDALKRLQLAALAAGADGIVDLRYETDDRNLWDQRCWDSLAAHGTAVKFERPLAATTALPAAAIPVTAGAAALPETPGPATAAGSTVSSSGDLLIASGQGRAELMDWIRRLGIPRSAFIARGPGDGNLDWLDSPAEVGSWMVKLPKSSGRAGTGTVAGPNGLALVPGQSSLAFTSRQLGYDMSGTWTLGALGTWDLSDRHLRRVP